MNEIAQSSYTKVSDLADRKKQVESLGLLHEMIRSFTTLARTLNLSHAVKELGSTRQTLRRHIALLEQAKGTPLFSVEDRQYRLTEAGARALPEALDILARGNSWLSGTISHVDGLQHLSHSLPSGWNFWQQQRPISDLWKSGRPLLRETLRAWTISGGGLEHPELQHIRPYFMVYRDSPSGWICVELGDTSSYVSWFGWTNARSSIGRDIGKMPGGDDFARLLVMPFDEVRRTQNVRLDHVFTQIKRDEDGPLVPICYQRLLLGGRFPDDTFALISVVDRSYEIDIDGLPKTELKRMPEELVMKIDPSVLKYEQK